MINKDYCREYCKKHFISTSHPDAGTEYCRNHGNHIPLECLVSCIHNSPDIRGGYEDEVICSHCGAVLD